MGDINHDAVLRARVLLLGSGEPTLREQVNAYRVLAEVSPKAYLPKLVDALLLTSYRNRDPWVDLALGTEAVEAARRIDAEAPARTARLCNALDVRQRALFALGRREEARAVCEELAGAGRFGRLADVLAEEGRYREAAELKERAARNGVREHFRWYMLEWAANLEGAGRHEEALKVFGELVDETRRKIPTGRTAPGSLAGALVHLSLMHEAAGRGADAAAARREALTVLEELAATDGGGMDRTYWVTLFVLSGRVNEPPASPTSPMPPFGTHIGWSPDATHAFFDALPRLEEEAALLREAGRLTELVDMHRRISIRVVRREGDHHYRFEERLRPYFDEGVAPTRRLTDDPSRLARALTDRSMFHLAADALEPAYADFAEAVTLLDAR